MQITVEKHPLSREELIKLIQEKEQLIAEQQDKIQHQAQKIHDQEQQIKQFIESLQINRYRAFGAKSEKFFVNQLSLFDEAVLPKDPEKLLEAEESIQVSAHNRTKKPGRKPLPAHFPRIQKIYDLEEHEKVCHCGCQLTYLGTDSYEQAEIIPAKIYVIEHLKKKYACKACEETLKTATMPAQPIPRSIAGPGLLSHVLVSKFQDHLPLYRQEQMLRRIGIDIPRSSLCLWVIRTAELLAKLREISKKHLIAYDIAYADETTVQVLKEKTKCVQAKKYMWLFSGGPPEQFVFYYHYHPQRSHEVAVDFFHDFKGYLHCDGYAAYDTLTAKNTSVTLVGCLYHARRKFIDVIKVTKATTGIAVDVVTMIAEIANIEGDIKEFTADEKYHYRLTHAKPLLDKLYAYLMENQPRIVPKSLLGQAVAYTLNQWTKLLNYLKDGRLENNNNRSERAIKPFATGRKGWLFADSVAGAHAAATLFSFVETCKFHDIEPYDWFRYVLARIPLCKTDEELAALLPFNIDRDLLKIPDNL